MMRHPLELEPASELVSDRTRLIRNSFRRFAGGPVTLDAEANDALIRQLGEVLAGVKRYETELSRLKWNARAKMDAERLLEHGRKVQSALSEPGSNVVAFLPPGLETGEVPFAGGEPERG